MLICEAMSRAVSDKQRVETFTRQWLDPGDMDNACDDSFAK